MSDFSGMEDLLQDFLVEAGDLLSGVDNKLVDLERAPDDKGLLNDIFRGFTLLFCRLQFVSGSCDLIVHLTELFLQPVEIIRVEVFDTIEAH